MRDMDRPAGRLGRSRALTLLIACSAVASTLGTSANAKVFVFGDSLSDNGNNFRLTFGYEPSTDEYFNGRYSNGPVWVERLAGGRLGNSPGLLFTSPGPQSWYSGYDFAHGGASARELPVLPDAFEGPGQVSYFRQQVSKGRLSVSRDDLATLWIGANDYLLFGAQKPQDIVDGVMKALTDLDGSGVGKIVLINNPLLGEVPGEIQGARRALLDALSVAHNSLLSAAVNAFLPNAKSNIIQIDAPKIQAAIALGVGGFTVVKPGDKGSQTGNCLGDGLVLAACPSNYFFYDGVHPTSSGHQFIASVVQDKLQMPVTTTSRVNTIRSSLLSLLTNQLGLIGGKLGNWSPTPGLSPYSFGDWAGFSESDSARAGAGADWTTGDVSLGFNFMKASDRQHQDDADISIQQADNSGVSAYAVYRGDGFTSSVALTQIDGEQNLARRTSIETLGLATSSQASRMSAAQWMVGTSFDWGGVSITPEAGVLGIQMRVGSAQETGTLGLSDNSFDTVTEAGLIGQARVTIAYEAEDWGVSLALSGATTASGTASPWATAPSDLVRVHNLAIRDDRSDVGGGVWAKAWLAGGDQYNLSVDGGAFTDGDEVESAVRLNASYRF